MLQLPEKVGRDLSNYLREKMAKTVARKKKDKAVEKRKESIEKAKRGRSPPPTPSAPVISPHPPATSPSKPAASKRPKPAEDTTEELLVAYPAAKAAKSAMEAAQARLKLRYTMIKLTSIQTIAIHCTIF